MGMHRIIIASGAILILASLAVLTFSVIPANAEKAQVFLGWEDSVETIWSSESPRHIAVTVTNNGSMADSSGDQSRGYLAVTTDNYHKKLYAGESCTFDDGSATFFRLEQTPAYDHNDRAYWGIYVDYELEVSGSGGAGSGGAALAFVALILIVVGIAIAVRRARSHRTQHAAIPPQSTTGVPVSMPGQPYMSAPATAPMAPVWGAPSSPQPTGQPASAPTPVATGVCPSCHWVAAQDAAFCGRCGTRLR